MDVRLLLPDDVAGAEVNTGTMMLDDDLSSAVNSLADDLAKGSTHRHGERTTQAGDRRRCDGRQ